MARMEIRRRLSSWDEAPRQHPHLPPHPGRRHRRPIVAVGEGVAAARIGERVMVDFSIYNRDDD